MSRKYSVKLALTLVCVVVAAAAQAQGVPKPGPEHEKLGFFVGEWRFEGEARETAMGPGGTIQYAETCELFEGGFALVCRSDGTNPMGPAKTLSIMSYDSGNAAYTYHAVESNAPAFTAMGKREGKTWHWKSETKMGSGTMKARVTITEISPTTYTFKMQMSTDGGANWITAVEGKAAKTIS